jgi:hypothetical protein
VIAFLLSETLIKFLLTFPQKLHKKNQQEIILNNFHYWLNEIVEYGTTPHIEIDHFCYGFPLISEKKTPQKHP